jgi:hypothetical protein
VTGVADVQVAGEKQIGSARGKFPDCHTGPPDKVATVMSFRQIERVMGDHDFDNVRAKRGKHIPPSGRVLKSHISSILEITKQGQYLFSAQGIHSDSSFVIYDLNPKVEGEGG